MTTELAQSIEREHVRSMTDVLARAVRIKEIQGTLMKPNVHYGVIPGTQKPTLYQPGADLLLVTFRIAAQIKRLDDLSERDLVRYRVTVAGINQINGGALGEGIGECSTDEERYRWRRVVCEEEWEDTPAERRREKWARGSNGKGYKLKQVRTNVADVSNTVLKIATKRAKVAMALNVTAASDVFQQDIEDLTDELREQLIEEARPEPAPKPATRKSKSEKAEPEKPEPKASEPAPPAEDDQDDDDEPDPPIPVGTIKMLHERPNALLVELDSGFVCSTRHAATMEQLRELFITQPPPRVAIQAKPSSDQKKYAPILDSITVLS